MPRKIYKVLVIFGLVLGLVLFIGHYIRLEQPDPDKMAKEQKIIADMVTCLL